MNFSYLPSAYLATIIQFLVDYFLADTVIVFNKKKYIANNNWDVYLECSCKYINVTEWEEVIDINTLILPFSEIFGTICSHP